jgi:hypothetical protein
MIVPVAKYSAGTGNVPAFHVRHAVLYDTPVCLAHAPGRMGKAEYTSSYGYVWPSMLQQLSTPGFRLGGGLSDRDSAIALGIVCPPERRPAAQEIKKSPDWPV